jgi:nitrate/TMAO reductase-like tetraheme cytochrome c subunit
MGHAKAFERLEAEDQANEECLTCHATGKSAEMPGVQCEACHGPGSDYKGMKVMKDPEASLAAGLVIPDEASCLTCHTGAPHEQPEFDFASAAKHEVKQKTE